MIGPRRVLIITYYWPPSGGSGVQRWLKMAKYLPEFGWEPIIFTPQNPELMARDEELLKEVSPKLTVWKTPIWEPYKLYKFFTKKKGQMIKSSFVSDNAENPSWKERLSLFIRSNFFFPDPRCFWRRPSVRYLCKRLKEYPVDWIITTGPPHSMHLIGKDLQKKMGIPWLADFRDPWTGIYYFKHLAMLPSIVKRHKRAEQAVVGKADVVTVVSPQMKREFLVWKPKRIEVVPNGYDESDFFVEAKRFSQKFALIHTGLFTKDANPNQLWLALANIVAENSAFAHSLQIVLVGHTDGAIRQSIEEAGLLSYCLFVNYVSHLEAVAYQKGANLLLLTLKKEPESKGILTGKLFEYLAAKKPVLGIGPLDGDLAEILSDCKGGTMHEFEDYEGFKRTVLHYYGMYVKNEEWSSSSTQTIEKYSRKHLCGKLADLLLSPLF